MTVERRNVLIKRNPRLLKYIPAQPYIPPDPPRAGYWRTTTEQQYQWVPMTETVVQVGPNTYQWTYRWFDVFQYIERVHQFTVGGNGTSIGRSPPITYRNGRMGTMLRGPDIVVNTWEPPYPGTPGMPYVPEQYIYEDLLQWNAGAHSIPTIGWGQGVEFSVDPVSAGVTVTLDSVTRRGRYWDSEWALLFTSGLVEFVERGEASRQLGYFTEETRFFIDRTRGTISIYALGDPTWDVSLQDTNPGARLLMDVSLYASGDNLYTPSITDDGVASLRPANPYFESFDSSHFETIEDWLDTDGMYIFINTFPVELDARGGDAKYGQVDVECIEPELLAADIADYQRNHLIVPPPEWDAMRHVEIPVLDPYSTLYVEPPTVNSRDGKRSLGSDLYTTEPMWLLSDMADVAVVQLNAPLLNLYSTDDDPDRELYEDYPLPFVNFRVSDIDGYKFSTGGRLQLVMSDKDIEFFRYSEGGRLDFIVGYEDIDGVLLRDRARLMPDPEPLRASAADVMVCGEGGGFVTQYRNYPFTSMARIGEGYYGVRDDGFYLLEGDSDAGEQIVADIDLGTHDFMTNKVKGVRSSHAEIASLAPARLKVTTRQGTFVYPQRSTSEDIRTQRFDMGRGLRDVFYDMQLSAPASGLQVNEVRFDVDTSERRL